MDDVYRDRQDPALTVCVRADRRRARAAARDVSSGLDHHAVDAAVATWRSPSARTSTTRCWSKDGADATSSARPALGAYAKELRGLRAGRHGARPRPGRPPLHAALRLPRRAGRRRTPSRCSAADFVTTEDGTGVVHLAPAFGEDDQNVCNAAGIPTVVTVDDHTRFTALVPTYQGVQVFDANKPIIAGAQGPRRGAAARHATRHSYPHCWRCDTPLVYKAVSSWFVAVTQVPGPDGRAEPGDQLDAGAHQGRLVRQVAGERPRLVDQPEPVLGLADPGVEVRRPDTTRGSTSTARSSELERDFGVTVTDLHRPYVDELTRPNPDDPTGQSTMRRVPEVLDCWFESGSMPFAQVHYPFENARLVRAPLPGRLHRRVHRADPRLVLHACTCWPRRCSTGRRSATASSHGILLGDDGRKMSKSLRNYPDVYEMFDSYGSDAMRWMLMSSPVLRGGDMPVTEPAIRDAVRQVLLPLWNVWYFFALYANAAGSRGRPSDRLRSTCSTGTSWPRPASWSSTCSDADGRVRHLRCAARPCGRTWTR